jgi:hypothetical protein
VIGASICSLTIGYVPEDMLIVLLESPSAKAWEIVELRLSLGVILKTAGARRSSKSSKTILRTRSVRTFRRGYRLAMVTPSCLILGMARDRGHPVVGFGKR